MERFEMVMRVGMVYNEETEEVVTDGVKFEILDSEGDVLDLEDNEILKQLAKDCMQALQEKEAE